jgi:hypothetical protein
MASSGVHRVEVPITRRCIATCGGLWQVASEDGEDGVDGEDGEVWNGGRLVS